MSVTQAEKITDELGKLNFETVQRALKQLPVDIQTSVSVYLKGNTPARYHGTSFEGIDKPYQEEVRSVIDGLFSENPKGLFLTGDVGTGKTSILRVIWKYTIAGIICREYRKILRRFEDDPYEREGALAVFLGNCVNLISNNCEFITNWQLVRDLRKHVEGEFSQAAHYTPHTLSDFLFLDDLGRGYEDEKGWNLALQDEFFDARWQTMRPIFVSTNKRPQELREWPGWSRIVDRLADASSMVMVNIGEGSRRKA